MAEREAYRHQKERDTTTHGAAHELSGRVDDQNPKRELFGRWRQTRRGGKERTQGVGVRAWTASPVGIAASSSNETFSRGTRSYTNACPQTPGKRSEPGAHHGGQTGNQEVEVDIDVDVEFYEACSLATRERTPGTDLTDPGMHMARLACAYLAAHHE
ncbi:hypothetical protein FA95DRAFT_1575627 [Auriscalpium vulgare]|uniref:Uncharacterized protein n=1 Tax=Auriscalpium vulgare TaxID=40419 RepID=A0ACB8REU7_9AGAM|nr:hypothetical protein FA95DRAFT_1575627 [Auriscalpium vulgare]